MQNNVPPKRRGSLSLEALLLIPVFLCVLFAVVEFGLMLASQTLIKSAAAQAAQVAALGGSDADILIKVADVLGMPRFAAPSLTVVATINSDPPVTLSPVPSGPYTPPMNVGDTVQICITVTASDWLPDLLACCGFSLGTTQLAGCASAVKM